MSIGAPKQGAGESVPAFPMPVGRVSTGVESRFSLEEKLNLVVRIIF